MDNGYTNNKVHKTILDTYKELDVMHKNRFFYLMECSGKNGGKLKLHKTHQNGLSIDFMSPKKSKKFHPKWNSIGLMHYLLEFDNDGKLNFDNHVEIDFELMADHILTLNKNANLNGLIIKKVILKIELKDDLFNTSRGNELKSSGIYFAKSLPKWANKMHDDHYHIDFEIN